MTEYQVYWWVMLSNIQGAAQFLGIVFGVISVVGIISSSIACWEKSTLKYLKLHFIFIPLFLLSCTTCLIPNSKQYAMIKVFPKIINSDVAQDIQNDFPELYKMAKEYLKDMLKTSE